ncbi:hypothetical protein SC482_000379 [Campylobacter jejuni]|uniref:hypothetical protein n=1 Tax=Campylobacter jejuni TaxID=197 RepID=UPI000B231FE4|nr:hypothetical protein [Campylobacter jejuni]HEE9519501.1 hypothetical protein [Campylobacter jejuni subsp. jejuni]EHP1571027.1 hypothetical protein [Campylobacter jejuni]EHY7812230.1 hypothetical protein [Campylobacter jejuni]EIE9545257.1 hypothetical protein [Campylobacter jejuni]EIF7500756.1 hypothetical protein [Campylobacter jejuni]
MFSFILSRFLSPSKIAFFVLIALCGFLYLKNNALALENENLKLKAYKELFNILGAKK